MQTIVCLYAGCMLVIGAFAVNNCINAPSLSSPGSAGIGKVAGSIAALTVGLGLIGYAVAPLLIAG